MSRVYDNWERLVEATLKRELLRELALCPSISSSSSIDLSSSFDSLDFNVAEAGVNSRRNSVQRLSGENRDKLDIADLRLAKLGGQSNFDLIITNEILKEEVHKLRVQVESLKNRCELQDLELKESAKQAHEATALATEESAKCKAAKDVIKSLTSQLKDMAEWIEQYEPGVYITLIALRDGTRDLKRVRFSRRRFGERQAETWWSENREKVYERYNVRGSNKSSVYGQSARRSEGALSPSSQF